MSNSFTWERDSSAASSLLPTGEPGWNNWSSESDSSIDEQRTVVKKVLASVASNVQPGRMGGIWGGDAWNDWSSESDEAPENREPGLAAEAPVLINSSCMSDEDSIGSDIPNAAVSPEITPESIVNPDSLSDSPPQDESGSGSDTNSDSEHPVVPPHLKALVKKDEIIQDSIRTAAPKRKYVMKSRKSPKKPKLNKVHIFFFFFFRFLSFYCTREIADQSGLVIRVRA